MIELKNVSFRYSEDHKESISSVNLKIKKGEFVLLTGRSGSGKTTVTRCINGLIPHFYEGVLSGEILLDGKDVRELQLHEIAERVGSVFQDPRSQFFTADTTSEMAFACENLGLPREEIVTRIQDTVSCLKMEDLLERSIFRLSSGEKQRVAIASVHAAGPAIYVLDEPSANLDHEATGDLRQILARLKEQGHTVIIAEHRLYYLKDLADRIIYMEDGRITEEYDRKTFLALPDEERNRKGLRCISPETLGLDAEANDSVSRPDRYLRLDGLCFGYPGNGLALSSLRLTGDKGDIIGIVGPNGAGKSTLARVLCGLLKEKAGNVLIDGRKSGPRDRVRQAYFVMQDSDYQLFTESVEEELKLGNEDLPGLAEKTEETLQALNLSEFKDRHPASLSGGQKQRVTIAVAIVKGSSVLVFDEPTSGLDADNMRRVAAMIKKMAAEGRTVIVISHDYEFILHTCTRIVRLADGQIGEEFRMADGSLGRLRCMFFGS